MKKIKDMKIEVDTTFRYAKKNYNEVMELIEKEHKGWRLPTHEEFIDIINRGLFNDFWDGKHDIRIKQPFKKLEEKSRVAWFDAFSDWVDLYCVRGPQDSYPALGVILCREIKK